MRIVHGTTIRRSREFLETTPGLAARAQDVTADLFTIHDVNIERAATTDAEGLLAMRERLSAWLAIRGVMQWQPGSLTIARLREQIAEGHVYTGRFNGHLVGSFTLTDEDERIWGTDATSAAYVHRLMVDRRWAHRGFGAALLTWAEEHCRSQEKTHVRLDCVEINNTLVEYYRSAGYTEVRRVFLEQFLPHQGGLVLFEKALVDPS
jgi:GNAT superfamily N-acetyltransferase